MHAMKLGRLFLMTGLHFVAMYLLMYSMVNVWQNVIPNINQFYMAAVMTAPMLALEALLMGSMYGSPRIMNVIFVTSIALGVLFFFLIRQQTLINDRELARSMIPHHAGAILMCRQANLEDREVRELCEEIIDSQEREIRQMRRVLNRLD